MLQISKVLFEEWNKCQLLYCHWKSNEHLDSGLDGDTDLDILLSKQDQSRGEKTLLKFNFLKCKSQFGSRYPDVDDWIGFDGNTGKLIHLHLHYVILTGHKGLKEFNLPWTLDMLRTRKKEDHSGVYIADPNIELVTLYSRIALKVSIDDLFAYRLNKYAINNSFLKEIQYLKNKIEWPIVAHYLEDYYPQDYCIVLSIIKKDCFEVGDIFRLRKIAEKNFLSVNRFKHTFRFLEFYYKYLIRLRKLIRLKLKQPIIIRKVPISGKGLQVAFIGQDGAGKTTVTSEIKNWWAWKLDVQYVYLGSGENFHSWQKSILKKIPRSSFFRVIRALLQLSKFRKLSRDVRKKLRRWKRYADKGGLVIYDRFPQVQFPGICDGPKIRSLFIDEVPKFFRCIINRLAAKEEFFLKESTKIQPDIIFKLTLPPEESIRRKPENTIESIRLKHDIINSLKFNNSEVILIDATMPFDEEIRLIKRTLWEYMVRK